MWASLSLAVIQAWPSMVMGSIDTAHAVLGLVLPGGYDGPTTLFAAANKVADRVMDEPTSWGWTLSGAVTAMAQEILFALCAFFILIGLCIPGLLAIMAEVATIIGGMAAPLILGGLAFSPTRPLALGAINFLIASTLRIISLGLVSALFGRAIEAQLDLPGASETLTFAATSGLVLTSLASIVAGFGANSIAGSLTGGGIGTLGVSSFAQPVAAAATLATAAGGAMTAAGSAARAGGGPAGSMVGSAARSMGGGGGGGSISKSSGVGGKSAFGP